MASQKLFSEQNTYYYQLLWGELSLYAYIKLYSDVQMSDICNEIKFVCYHGS